jgi:hypothetical protein
VHLGLEYLVAVLAFLLGHVHRRVGVAQQLVGVLRADHALVAEGDPDARRDRDGAVGERERNGQRGHHPLGDLDGVQLALGVADEDRELVAAEARGGVDRTHAVLQAPPDLPEHLVAGGVPEAVIDVLEVVHVQEQDRHGQAVAPAADERMFDAVAEERPVGQAGERVVEGLVLELRLEGLALGDVADVDDDPGDRLLGEQVRAERLDVAPLVGGVAYAEFGRGGRPRRLTGERGDERQHALCLLGVDDVDERALGDRLGGMAEHLLDRGADVAHGAVAADDADDVGGVLDQRAEPCLRALLQGLLGQRRAVQRKGDLGGERREALLGGPRERLDALHGEHSGELLAQEQRRQADRRRARSQARDALSRRAASHRLGQLGQAQL